MAIDNRDDRTPAEAVAEFLDELGSELEHRQAPDDVLKAVLVAATPAVVSYYLKGL